MLATHKELAAKLAELETRIETHDENITALVSCGLRGQISPA
jgi:hypothetical protein